MRKEKDLFPSILMPVITPGASNFAVPWDCEKTGLNGKIISVDIPADDDEEHVSEKATHPVEAVFSSFDGLTIFKASAEEKDEPAEKRSDLAPTDPFPKIYCYEFDGAATWSTIAYPSLRETAPEPDEEPQYRIRQRNYTRSIPLSRRGVMNR